MSNNQSSYRQIFKATGLFGGVQFINILVNIIKSKFIAVLLGPTGMGVFGMLTSTTGMVTSLTNFGLGTSAVKNVAEAEGQRDRQRINSVVSTLRRMVWFTGLLGAFTMLILAHQLSKLSFGNSDYTYAFMCLSVTLLFSQLSTGQNVILQGTRKLKYLAKANVLGSLFGLFVTVPLYYVFGLDGIVPSIIISSAVMLALSWYFSRKVKIDKVGLSFKDLWREGKGMLSMGFLLSISGIISIAVSYVTRIFIAREGGLNEVGLYNAGFAIIVTYTGLVLSAMATDYYPRLSGVAHENIRAKEMINQQAEIAILILAPVLMLLLVFIRFGVELLYSSRFTAVIGMIQWAALGMFFRATSWSIGFLYLAKGATKLYFINELTANIYFLFFNIVGYKLWGLDGLGIAFLSTYIVYFAQAFVVSSKKYAFDFTKEFIKIFYLQLLCAVTCFSVMHFIDNPYQYVLGGGLIALSAGYSYIKLRDKLNLIDYKKKSNA